MGLTLAAIKLRPFPRSPPPPHTHTARIKHRELEAKGTRVQVVYWPFATLWLTDELKQSVPAHKHGSVGSKQSVNKASGRVVFGNNGKALWGCADRTVSSNSGSGSFLRLSKRAERSVFWSIVSTMRHKPVGSVGWSPNRRVMYSLSSVKAKP